MLILIESSVALLLFYAVYVLWLRKETFFTENRYYLLTAAVISLLVPWVNLTIPEKQSIEVANSFIVILDSIMVTTNGYEQKLAEQMSTTQWILITYLLGVLIMGLLFVFKVFQIYWLDKKSTQSEEYPVNVRLINKEVAPFSFLKRVYINPQLHDKTELDKIIAHENIHITQGHTIDCLFYELLVALFWFNPIVYRYRKSARTIHEFLADQGAIRSEGVSPKAYQHLLFEQATGIKELQLANSFNYSLIKKRLIMLTKIESSKGAKLRLLAFLPVLFSVLLVFGLNRANGNNIIEQLTKDARISEVKQNDLIQNQEEEKVLFYADEMPKYPGGEDALRRYIATNVVYPAKAKETGTEGKIFVSFVVNKTGNIENVRYVATRAPVREKNEIGEVAVVGYTEVFHKDGKDFESLKKEAVRVTQGQAQWEPGSHEGKPVNVEFTIPVNFILDLKK